MDEAAADEDTSRCAAIEEVVRTQRGDDLECEQPEREANTLPYTRNRVVVARPVSSVRLGAKLNELLYGCETGRRDMSREELTRTRRGLVTCAVSPKTLTMPAPQNHHLTESFMAQTRLGVFLPSFSLHCFSLACLFPRTVHQSALRPGLMSPFKRRALYSSASIRLRSKDAAIWSPMYAAPRWSCNLKRSGASSGRAYPRDRMGVIHPKVKNSRKFALTSGIISASSMDDFGGAALVDTKGTRVHLRLSSIRAEWKRWSQALTLVVSALALVVVPW